MEGSEQKKTESSASAQESAAQAAKSASEEKASEAAQELVQELAELAGRFVNVARVAWHSEQRKQMEVDLRRGIDTLGKSLEEGFQKVAASEEAKSLQTKAEDVGEKVASSKVLADLTNALKTGLAAVSEQLDKIAKEMEEKSAARPTGQTAEGAAKGGDDVKDIPIDKA